MKETKIKRRDLKPSKALTPKSGTYTPDDKRKSQEGGLKGLETGVNPSAPSITVGTFVSDSVSRGSLVGKGFNYSMLLLSLFSIYKSVKADCTAKGLVITFDLFGLLLLVANCGSRGCTAHRLHQLNNLTLSVSSLALRGTYYKVNRLLKVGYLYKVGNNFTLSLHAEKMLFSGIDRKTLLEFNAMVKDAITEDKPKPKVKRKAKAKDIDLL